MTRRLSAHRIEGISLDASLLWSALSGVVGALSAIVVAAWALSSRINGLEMRIVKLEERLKSAGRDIAEARRGSREYVVDWDDVRKARRRHDDTPERGFDDARDDT